MSGKKARTARAQILAATGGHDGIGLRAAVRLAFEESERYDKHIADAEQAARDQGYTLIDWEFEPSSSFVGEDHPSQAIVYLAGTTEVLFTGTEDAILAQMDRDPRLFATADGIANDAYDTHVETPDPGLPSSLRDLLQDWICSDPQRARAFAYEGKPVD